MKREKGRECERDEAVGYLEQGNINSFQKSRRGEGGVCVVRMCCVSFVC